MSIALHTFPLTSQSFGFHSGAAISRNAALRKANRNKTRDNRIYVRRHRGQPCRDVHVGKHLRFNGLEQQTILYVGDLPQRNYCETIVRCERNLNAIERCMEIARLILLARMFNVHCHTMTAHRLFRHSGSTTFLEQPSIIYRNIEDDIFKLIETATNALLFFPLAMWQYGDRSAVIEM